MPDLVIVGPSDDQRGDGYEQQHEHQRRRQGAFAALLAVQVLQIVDFRHIDDAALLVHVVGELNDELQALRLIRQRDDRRRRIVGGEVLGVRWIAVLMQAQQLVPSVGAGMVADSAAPAPAASAGRIAQTRTAIRAGRRKKPGWRRMS